MHVPVQAVIPFHQSQSAAVTVGPCHLDATGGTFTCTRANDIKTW
jgi:hypothetical protein